MKDRPKVVDATVAPLELVVRGSTARLT